MSYKILSLDGGGPWSLIQSRALGAVFGVNIPGINLLSKFDLVACNSGGAVVIAGLLAGMTPKQIESDCFANQARLHKIFSPSKTPLGHIDQLTVDLFHIGIYRYSTVSKLAALREVLGEVADLKVPQLSTLFGSTDHSPRFVFTAFAYDRLREVYFRSDPASPAARQDVMAPATLAEAVNASSSAPLLYFDAPAAIGTDTARERFWDGAVGGYNNPVLLAVTEALAYGHGGRTFGSSRSAPPQCCGRWRHSSRARIRISRCPVPNTGSRMTWKK
jgi:patatin-like phospholipase/acyl hydrolase